MLHHRIEVAIAMQQGVSLLDTKGGYQDVRCTPRRHPEPTQPPIVLRRIDGNRRSAEIKAWQFAQTRADFSILGIVAHALKNLLENPIA